jgi:hypothetical protein
MLDCCSNLIFSEALCSLLDLNDPALKREILRPLKRRVWGTAVKRTATERAELEAQQKAAQEILNPIKPVNHSQSSRSSHHKIQNGSDGSATVRTIIRCPAVGCTVDYKFRACLAKHIRDAHCLNKQSGVVDQTLLQTLCGKCGISPPS